MSIKVIKKRHEFLGKMSQTNNMLFGMRRFPDSIPKKPRIEIIPMIDVMMFLLVFFVLLGINVISANGLKTTLPSSTTASPTDHVKKVVITLAKTGEIQIDGTTVDNLSALKSAVLAIQAQDEEKLSVFINGDESVPLQSLVDVMDVLKTCNIHSMVIVAKKK